MHSYHILVIVLLFALPASGSLPFSTGPLVYSPVLATYNIAEYCPAIPVGLHATELSAQYSTTGRCPATPYNQLTTEVVSYTGAIRSAARACESTAQSSMDLVLSKRNNLLYVVEGLTVLVQLTNDPSYAANLVKAEALLHQGYIVVLPKISNYVQESLKVFHTTIRTL